jgi:hypothetical protein
MRRARKAASSGAGDSGVDPEAEFLKGPPPELPPEGGWAGAIRPHICYNIMTDKMAVGCSEATPELPPEGKLVVEGAGGEGALYL